MARQAKNTAKFCHRSAIYILYSTVELQKYIQVVGDWQTVSSFLKLASQYIFEMNGIKGQQKGTADEKKKNVALDIVAAVYHNGKLWRRPIQDSKTMTLQNFHEIFDTTITNYQKMPESYLKFDAVKNSNLNNNDPIIMYLQYDETHHLQKRK